MGSLLCMRCGEKEREFGKNLCIKCDIVINEKTTYSCSECAKDFIHKDGETIYKGNFKTGTHIICKPCYLEGNKGTKHDSGKGRYSLVLEGFSKALKAVVEVGTKGAEKYDDNNWKLVDKGKERYKDAAYRHLLEGDGVNEEDFGLLHAAHAAWDALAYLEFLIEEKGRG